MKKQFLFLMSAVFLVFMLSGVSAITIFSDWSGGAQNLQVTTGQSATFSADYFSLNAPMTVNIKLYNSSNVLVHSFESNKVVGGNGFTQNYTVTPAIYATTGAYTIVFTGSDSVGSVYSRSLTLTVNAVGPVNNAPVITTTAVTQVNESSAYIYNVDATDADVTDVLVYSLAVGAPAWLSINPFNGLITGTAPSVAADTNFPVTVSVTDGTATVTQTFNILVKDVTIVGNSAPVITTVAVTSVNESAAYTYDVNATDADGNTLTYSLTAGPAFLTISSTTGLITGTAPSVAADTPFTVTVSVSDGIAPAVTQTYTLTVKNIIPPVNNAPVITSTANTQVNESQNYVYSVVATDADGDALTYSLTTAPIWLTIDSVTGAITGTAPTVTVDTTFNVTVSVTDGTATATQSYIVTVKDVTVIVVNNAPTITTAPVVQVDELQNYTYQVNATDADGDVLLYSLAASPSWLSIDAVTGLITGVAPTVAFDTTFTVQIVVTDGMAIDMQTYTVTVSNVVSSTTTKHKTGTKTISDPLAEKAYLNQFNSKPTIDLGQEDTGSISLNPTSSNSLGTWGAAAIALCVLIVATLALMIVPFFRRI